MRDSILFWNGVALEANRVSHTDPLRKEQTGPTLSSRALAIVHLAMYDAYAGVVNNSATFPRYLPAPPPPPPVGSSHADAVAGAAYTTLSGLFTAQRDYFAAQLSGFDVGNASYQFGVAVGQAMLALRANDPDARDSGYKTSGDRGRHRVDPDNPGQGFHAPFYGAQSKCFAVSQRYGLNPPPFGNAEYLNALRQVREKGIKPELTASLPASFGNRRTADETLIGVFWGYDGASGLGTPPRLYNQIVRIVAAKRNNSEADNARLFAFVNAAMGDAGILSWEQKYCHDFWRPVVGIREHDDSFGPAAADPADAGNDISDDADPFWLPLGAPSTNSTLKNFTPPFPAYPSGHATFGAAALHVTRLFYGQGFAAGGSAVIPGGKPIIKNGNLVGDDLFDDLGLVSDEFDGRARDNQGTVRPRHVRNFPKVTGKPAESEGLGRMIIENARSRLFLGVHWIFDAFRLKSGKPDFGASGLVIGGVPLGLKIAEDIFKFGGEKAPKMTPAGSAQPPIATPDAETSGMPTVPKQPAKVGGCVAAKKKGALAAEAREELVKDVYLEGTSRR